MAEGCYFVITSRHSMKYLPSMIVSLFWFYISDDTLLNFNVCCNNDELFSGVARKEFLVGQDEGKYHHRLGQRFWFKLTTDCFEVIKRQVIKLRFALLGREKRRKCNIYNKTHNHTFATLFDIFK